MLRKYHIAFILLLVSIRIFAQTFSCDHTFYVIMQVDGKSVLHNMWLDESNKLQIKVIPLSQPERRYTCLGFSLADLYLYALDFNTKELLRIDANGIVTNLGIPENLDTSLEYWAGEVTPEGRRLLVVGYDESFGEDRSVYSINLTSSNFYAGSSGLVSYLPTKMSDLATDPVRGVTYGYDKMNKQVVVVGTNAITHHNHSQIEPIMESLFFDEGGNLYGYGSASSAVEQSTLYAIDKVKGGATPISNHQPGLYSDGCSCPATMGFTRTITPSRILPCMEFTIDYYITNHSGVGKTGVVFEDILPPSVRILEVTDHTFTLATIESGVGTNQLYIPNLDVLIGDNIIRVKAVLNATTESMFETQASLENLPLGLGGSLLSDDPFTPEWGDPNQTEVIQSSTVELEDYIQFDCGNEGARLSLPFEVDSYQWSDGSSDPTLWVSEPGQYWVEAVGECFTIKDTITIGDFPEPLQLDLGPDLELMEGTPLELSIVTNADYIEQLRWESAERFDLSCEDCSAPSLIAQVDNIYYLELTDGYGCTVLDSVRLSVIPARDIYVANAFSPNGDGVNDVFFIQGNNSQAIVREFCVFDRWGTQVFEKKSGNLNDEDHGWDGKINGRPASSNLYVWFATIEFVDGTTARVNGEILLVAN
jgi:gliding motility-associated-like protein